MNYINLDLYNLNKDINKRIFFIEENNYSSKIENSKYKNFYKYVNEYIYILEDIEDLEKINNIKFKTLNELIDLNFNECLIKEKIKIISWFFLY